MEESEARYRLPRSVVPSRYDLTLEPDLDAGTFAGLMEATVEVVEPVTEIVLNANELQLDEAALQGADGASVEVAKILTDHEAERATLELAETAAPGSWSLRIAFHAELNPRLTGFYRSVYREDGRTRVIGTTHFEATDARRAFPCWDEPDLKAVFGITIVVKDGVFAVSNGPEIEREPLDDGRVRIRFADTIPMSTYLAAWVVGPLDVTAPVDARGIPIRVVHVPGKGHLAPFALDTSVHSVNWFADYYGIPYPEAKLDNVAIPDFAQGAMENIGCITYREQVLLVDPDRATREERVDIAETIAHEIAHMWFGDLVTMRWWNGIWLNEAFATFMSMLAVDAYRPEWQRWNTFSTSKSAAFLTDGLRSTRPIEFTVRRPEECESMFDILTYEKGAAVLRMLEQYLGGKEFQKGIALYLKSHEYGNAETTDLWDAIEEATGEPSRKIMDSWIFQGGHPVVSVAKTATGNGLTLTQQRFRYLASEDDAAARWQVPVMLRVKTADGL